MLVSVAGNADKKYAQADFGYAPGQIVELDPELAQAWVSSGKAGIIPGTGVKLLQPPVTPSWPIGRRPPTETLFSVVVPVTHENKFYLNVLSSPGFKETGALIVPSRGAWCAAYAFYDGARQTTTPWVLYCHQDVHFGAGAGWLIDDALAKIPQSEARSTVIGFIGYDYKTGGRRLVGYTAHRVSTVLSGPESDAAVTVDELAVILHRESKLQIDPALGWHLWATDLCLQAIDMGGSAHVIRAPITHNTTGFVPAEFQASVHVLLKKHPQRDTIASLSGGDLRR